MAPRLMLLNTGPLWDLTRVSDNLRENRLNSGTFKSTFKRLNKEVTNPSNCLNANLNTCLSVANNFMHDSEYIKGRPLFLTSSEAAYHVFSSPSSNHGQRSTPFEGFIILFPIFNPIFCLGHRNLLCFLNYSI